MTKTALLVALGVLWGALRLAEYVRYKDGADVYDGILAGSAPQKVRSGDHWFQIASMLANWCEIFLLVDAYAIVPHPAVAVLASIFVAGRFRALQEAGHTALHLGFGASKKAQRAIADWLGNYLCWKPDSEKRFQSHCIGHHPHASSELDPNVHRLRRIGLVPGISPARFGVLFFWPLTPGGIRENLGFVAAAIASPAQLAERLVLNAPVWIAVWALAGGGGLAIYFVALLLLYPLYSWWSLLVEHRWFVPADLKEMTRTEYECTVARRTVYRSISAWLIRVLICPLTDSYHLAHHLYPRMHWRYMEQVDRALAQTNRAYAQGAHHGILVPFAAGTPSALGDLYDRLVRAPAQDSDKLASGAV